jgi:hypothetical protein
MSECPTRVETIEVNPVPEGYIVYDPERDRVHQLNHTAALVLEHCDGSNTSADIVRILQVAYDLPAPPEAATLDCIDRLRQEGLVA